MKKFATRSFVGLALLLLTACAATTGGEDIRVKCPSCGYEFDVERYGH